jgi:3alpha(or 20beta)-hydroxysteroid dehydrogenase
MMLSGKVALVSGGAAGMGASHCRAIVRQGGRVVIGDIDGAAGTALADELGPMAVYARLDVRLGGEWDAAVALAEHTFGKLDVLVNNAGVLTGSGVVECSDEEWETVIGINLSGAFKGIRAAVPSLARAAPSSIINVSSVAGLKGFSGLTAYGASKWGVRGLTKNTAIELAPLGIRVNSVHPGTVRTRMMDGFDISYDHVPQRRPGLPEEVSRLVVFLASDEASFSTGSEFVADGGESAGLPTTLVRDGSTT